MLFKDVRQNYPIFVLDKTDMSVTQCKVVEAGFPRYEASANQMVIDITATANGKSAIYIVPENAAMSSGNGRNILIFADSDSLIRELEVTKSTIEQELADVDKKKKQLEEVNKRLTEFNPVYKAQQATEQRFTNIEQCVATLSSNISKLENMMTTYFNNNVANSNRHNA